MKYLLRLVLAAALSVTALKAQFSADTADAAPLAGLGTQLQTRIVGFNNENAPTTTLVESSPNLLFINTGTASAPVLQPLTGFANYGSNVWLSFTAPTNGLVSVITETSNYDNTLALFRKQDDNTYVLVASNDLFGFQINAQLNLVPVREGEQYVLAIGGWLGTQGTSTISFPFLAGPYSVDTADPAPLVNLGIEFQTRIQNFTNVGAPNLTLQQSSPGRLFTNTGTIENPILAPLTGLAAYRSNIWYSFIPPSDGRFSVITDAANYDNTLALFRKLDDDIYILVANDDDGGAGLNAQINPLNVQGGVEYVVAVGGFGGAQGTSTLVFPFQSTGPVVEFRPQFPNNFENAFVLVSPSFGSTSAYLEGSNTNANSQFGEPNHANANILPVPANPNTVPPTPAIPGTTNKSVWFRFTAPFAGTFNITTQGSNFNTAISLYEGTQLDNLVLVAENLNTTFVKTFSTIKGAPGEQGKVYYIAVTGYQGASGLIDFSFNYRASRPSFKTNITDQTVLAGTDASFSVQTRTTDASLLIGNEHIDSGISFRWERQPAAGGAWAPLAESATYVGVDTENLTIVGATLAMNRDKFRLVVTDIQGTGISRVATLHVTAFAPVSTRVQGFVDIDLTDGVPVPPGTRYVASGLPPGLKLDPLTGRVTGIVGARTGTFLVQYYTIDANRVRSDILRLNIVVNDFLPRGTRLHYEALLEDGIGLPVGRLTINLAATGAFTGRIEQLDRKAFAFRGVLALDTDTEEAFVVVHINRGRNLNRYRLSLNVVDVDANGTLGEFSGVLEEVDANNNVVGFIGDTAADPFTELRTARTGLETAANYTLGLVDASDMGMSPIPEGGLSASGDLRGNTNRLNLRGHLGDGSPFTTSITTGVDNTFRLFALPYRRASGYVAGRFELVARPQNLTTDPTADPTLFHVDPAAGQEIYWFKAASTDIAFPAGFGPVGLRANLEPWRTSPLAFNTGLYLGIFPNGAVDVVISGDGIDNGGLNPLALPTTGNLNLQNQFVVPAPNSSAFTLRITPRTGAFTGTFRFVENVGGRDITRTARINGVLIQQSTADVSDVIGIGHFTVPAATRGAPPRVGRIELRKPAP